MIGSLFLVAALAAPLHPDSLSSARLTVQGSSAHLLARVQVLSLLEVLPALDADGDGEVVASEVAAMEPAILAYVGAHLGLRADTDREGQGGTPLVPIPLDAVHRPEGTEDGIGFRKGAVDVQLQFEHHAPLADLVVESSLFHATSPLHIDLVTVDFNGEEHTFSLVARQPSWRLGTTSRGVVRAYLALGWEHILGGWDHLAFVAVLVLGSRRLGSLLGLVTAFTVAHSVSLGLAATGVVDIGPVEGFVEMVIALSIAYVAVDTALTPDRQRARWLEAFVFGLIHGLGFAAFLGRSLVEETSRITALLAFNLGVEAGQVLVVIVLALGLAGLARLGPGEHDGFLAPRGVRRWASAALAVVALSWFVERL